MGKELKLKKNGEVNRKEGGQYLMSDGKPYPFLDFDTFWDMCKDLNYLLPRDFIHLKEKYKEIKDVIENRETSLVDGRIKEYLTEKKQQRLINLFGYLIQKEHKEKYSKPVSVLDYLKANHERGIRIEKMLEELLKK